MGNLLERKSVGGSAQGATVGAAGGTPGKRTLTEQLTPVRAQGGEARPRTGSGAGAGIPATYTVQAGESLPVVAVKLHTTVEALKAANAGKLKSFPTKSGGTVQGFNAGEVIDVPMVGAGTATGAHPGPASAGPEAVPEHAGSNGSLEGLSPGGGDASSAEDDARAAGDGTSSAGTPEASTAPLAELTDAQRGARLSTLHADELGEINKFGMSKTGRAAAQKRGAWLSAAAIRTAGSGKAGEAFVDSVDALVDKTEFTEDQGKIIAAAKEFAALPKVLTPEQESKAVIDWSKSLLTLDGVSLNDDLKARLVRYVRFLAWAGLVTGPTQTKSVMRSPKDAHRLSVAWMFNLDSNKDSASTLHKAENRQKLVDTVTARGGSDTDGNNWLSPSIVEGLKAKRDDDAELFKYIQTTAAPEAHKVKTQPAIAAEGYKTADRRHPNVLPGNGVSNHLLGEAVDVTPPFVFNNKFDPIIDAIAMYFGLWRAVKDNKSSPEHWHYERLGMPPGAETHDDGAH